jgi:hypothetical protein
MRSSSISEIARTVVRRNTEEVQGGGNFELFEELFADDFIDHTPQPNMTPDKAGARGLYLALRSAFPDFHAEIHWQTADGEIVTTYKTYYGTHAGRVRKWREAAILQTETFRIAKLFSFDIAVKGRS